MYDAIIDLKEKLAEARTWWLQVFIAVTLKPRRRPQSVDTVAAVLRRVIPELKADRLQRILVGDSHFSMNEMGRIFAVQGVGADFHDNIEVLGDRWETCLADVLEKINSFRS